MKTLNLFLKMHFTSLSPDGQIVSLAIVTHERHLVTPHVVNPIGRVGYESKTIFTNDKSFYAEFTDFDINRCDDWVKENVVSKLHLKYGELPIGFNAHTSFDLRNGEGVAVFQNTKERTVDDRRIIYGSNVMGKGDSGGIKHALEIWLSQFYDYKLNFIVDCGWFTWGKFVELMGEWEEFSYKNNGIKWADNVKIGLPKLPSNFPRVPQELNELIAFTRGIGISEAFELDREELLAPFGLPKEGVFGKLYSITCEELGEKRISNKYNALWDVNVAKAIYEKFV